MILKVILDFLLILMACRLRARAAAPASSGPSASRSLPASSSLVGTAGGPGRGAGFDGPAEPLPHDSMELRRDLSVSVV